MSHRDIFRFFRRHRRRAALNLINSPPMKVNSPAFAEALEFRQLLSTTVYDPASDFSHTSNPNGPWTFGNSTAETSQLIPYTATRTGTGANAALQDWNADTSGAIGKNTGSAEIVIGEQVIPGNQMYAHPGVNGEYTHLLFTAPADGDYSVQFLFSAGNMYPTTTDVHMLYNGTSMFDGAINNYGDTAGTTVPLTGVTQGSTIDLAVGYGSNGNYIADLTLVNEQITGPAAASSDRIEITTPPDEVIEPGHVLNLEAQVSDVVAQAARATVSPAAGSGGQNPLKGIPVQFHMIETDAAGNTIASRVLKAVTNVTGKASVKVISKLGGIASFVADAGLKDGSQITSGFVKEYFSEHLRSAKHLSVHEYASTPQILWTSNPGISYELIVKDETPGASPTQIADVSGLSDSFTFANPLKPGHQYSATVQGSQTLTIPGAKPLQLMSNWSAPVKFKLHEQQTTSFAARVDSSVSTKIRTLVTLTARTKTDEAGQAVDGPPRLLQIIFKGSWGSDVSGISAFASFQTQNNTYLELANDTDASIKVHSGLQTQGVYNTEVDFTIIPNAHDDNTPATFTVVLTSDNPLIEGTYTGKLHVKPPSQLDKTIWPNG